MNIVLSFCSSAINSLLLSGADGNFPLHYNSMSWASSSEKSDMELSEEESPPPSSCSFRASSVAYLWMYSEKERRHGKRSKSSCHVHRNTHPLSHTNRSSGELCVFQITAFIKWLPNYFWEKLRNLSIFYLLLYGWKILRYLWTVWTQTFPRFLSKPHLLLICDTKSDSINFFLDNTIL